MSHQDPKVATGRHVVLLQGVPSQKIIVPSSAGLGLLGLYFYKFS